MNFLTVFRRSASLSAQIVALALWLCGNANAHAAVKPPEPPLGSRWEAFTTPIFRNLTQDTGLPRNSELSALGQDGAGFMWLGTQSGLMRWDGYQFKKYLPDPKSPGALPDDYILALHTDKAGRLWIGTNVGGLALYDPKHDAFIRYGVKSGLDHATVSSIADDGANGLWLGSDLGLVHLDTRTDKARVEAPAAEVLALLHDRTGALWVATHGGLLRQPPAAHGFAQIKLPTAGGEVATASALFEDDAGRIWIGTQHHGAYVVLPGGVKPAPPGVSAEVASAQAAQALASTGVVAITQSLDGRVWFGSASQGVFVLDPARMTMRHFQRDLAVQSSLSDNTIMAEARDRSGLIWLATMRGLSVTNPNRTELKTVFGTSSQPRGIAANGIVSFLPVPGGRIWMGRGDHGVDIVDPVLGPVGEIKSNGRDPEHALPEVYVRSMALTNSGAVYLGTKQGLYRTTLTAKRVDRVHVPNDDSRVGALLVQGDVLWVGSLGVTRIPLGPRGGPAAPPRPIEAGLPNTRIGSLAPGPNGSIWVGTHKGSRGSTDRRCK